MLCNKVSLSAPNRLPAPGTSFQLFTWAKLRAGAPARETLRSFVSIYDYASRLTTFGAKVSVSNEIMKMHYCYFYRPQRSWGKVMFSVACIKNSVHGGGGSTWAGTPPRQVDPAPWIGTPPGQAHIPWAGTHPLEQVHIPPGQVHPPAGTPPHGQ